MIYLYGPQHDLADSLESNLRRRAFETQVFDDAQSLASLLKKEIPVALVYDLRFDDAVPKLLERVYLNSPEIIVIGIGERHLEEFEEYTDQIFLPHFEIEQMADQIVDHINGRKLLESCGFVGRSPELVSVARIIEQVAPTDITVLITGPSGTGKEMAARAIHKKSGKPEAKFVSLNIGSLAPGVLESELFGHERGSFTGAIGRRIGHFEQASGGTLFLDEIGELPPDIQVKLLRVLEEKSIYRVGGQEKISMDARLIFATNKNLEDEVLAGRFRQDLYYRLNVVNIAMLPLIARPKDIPPLVKHFIKQSRQTNHSRDGRVEPGAMKLFLRYHWPGNVRELRNVVESILILDRGVISQAAFEKYLQEKSLHDRQLPVPTGRTPAAAEHQLIIQALLSIREEISSLRREIMEVIQPTSNKNRIPLEQEQTFNIDEHERELITKTLEEVKGNRRKAAQLLGIGERTLYRKLARYGLK